MAATVARVGINIVDPDQKRAEALADAYLNGAEGAGDAVHLERLQSLAGRAIARLAWVRDFS